MLKLEDIWVTQDSVRDIEALDHMEFFVYNGGFWTHEELHKFARKNKLRTSPLIQISRFEDGRLFLHDGHHRGIATYLGDRDYLRDDEYQISQWLYEDYTKANLTANWYTPFDPRTELRIPDLQNFKSNCDFIGIDHNSTAILDYIERCRNDYVLPRGNITHIPSLANKIQTLLTSGG